MSPLFVIILSSDFKVNFELLQSLFLSQILKKNQIVRGSDLPSSILFRNVSFSYRFLLTLKLYFVELCMHQRCHSTYVYYVLSFNPIFLKSDIQADIVKDFDKTCRKNYNITYFENKFVFKDVLCPI